MLVRRSVHADWTLDSVLADTPEISIAQYSLGEIYIPTGSPINSVTYYVAPYSGGTYVAAYDSTPAAVTHAVAAARAYPIPSAVFGSGQIKIVTNADGAVSVSLKS